MGRKVKVVTKCGEEYVYTYDQDVDSVEIVEKKNYPLQERFDVALEALNPDCTSVSCYDCAFADIGRNCLKHRARSVLEEAVGYNE